MPAASGAAAEVPVCLSVQPVPVPRRQSVVTWETGLKSILAGCVVLVYLTLGRMVSFNSPLPFSDISSSHNSCNWICKLKLLDSFQVCSFTLKSISNPTPGQM